MRNRHSTKQNESGTFHVLEFGKYFVIWQWTLDVVWECGGRSVPWVFSYTTTMQDAHHRTWRVGRFLMIFGRFVGP